MKKSISGVLGPISTEKLGTTLIHEHVISCCDWSMRAALGSLYFEDEVLMPFAIQKLREAKDHGIDTVVDGTPINLGRDARGIVHAARESGVNIIASSGFYHHEEAVAGFKSEEELTELLVCDCILGMQDTGALPGILKFAVDWKGFTPYVSKILRVTAAVSSRTSLPVFCHSIPELHQGPELVDLFERNGVPANAVIVGHHGDVDEIDYLESVLCRGCYLGLDRFGIEGANPATKAENRAETLFALWHRGYGDRLLIGHDYAPYNGFWPAWPALKEQLGSDPVDYTYFGCVIAPMLKEKGLTDDDLRHLLVDNPRRFFEEAYEI